MSPEQAWGDERVDHRADIWAIGVVLYEAVCGQSAFACTDYAGFLKALAESELTPLSGEGAELGKIISRATTKACEERYPSTEEFVLALTGFLRDRGVFEDLAGDSLPQHWATPGSLIYRAWRGGNPPALWSEKPDSYARTRVADAAARPAKVRPDHSTSVSVSSKVRRVVRRQPSSRAWQALSLVVGGIFGVTISLARTSGSRHFQARPAVAHALAESVGPVNTTLAAPSVMDMGESSMSLQQKEKSANAAPTDLSSGHAQRKAKKKSHKNSGENRPSPKNETRDGSSHRWKTKRAYATTSPSGSGKQPRTATAQRGAADSRGRYTGTTGRAGELGLKTPW